MKKIPNKLLLLASKEELIRLYRNEEKLRETTENMVEILEEQLKIVKKIVKLYETQ